MLQNLQNTGKLQPFDSGAGNRLQPNRTRLTDEERRIRHRESVRAYYYRHHARVLAAQRDNYRRNRDARLAWQREYHARHDRKQNQREYYQRNRAAILAKQRERDFRRKCRECGVVINADGL